MITIDRRTALAGITGAGSGLALGAGAVAAGAAPSPSPFGEWRADAHGLPCYEFTGDVPVKTQTPAGHSYPLEPDPLFLLGNADLTLFASVAGHLLFVSGERGWVRLNEPAGARPGNSATLTVGHDGMRRTHDLLGAGGICASARTTTRSFGCGTTRYRMEVGPGLVVERILSVAPADEGQRGQPAVVLTVRLHNTGATPLDLDHVETVLSNPTLLQDGKPKGSVSPVRFTNQARALPEGRGVICEATATSADPKLLTAIDVPSQHNLYPPSLVLATAPMARSATIEFAHDAANDGTVALSARSRLRLAPGATRDIVMVIALQSREAPPGGLDWFAAGLAPSPTGDWFRREWAGVLAPMAQVPDPALRAEMLWNGHALLAMATYAAYYRQTFIPQGMTYDYVIDENAGPRDHLQHALAAAYFAPGLARSAILFTLCTMTPQGAIKFTVTGNGETASSTWSPSDHSLYLFYAIGEYLRITKDWAFLEESTLFLPGADGVSGTVLQKLERAFKYLRDHVSTGPHGLVRLGTGDWNDQIYMGLPEGQYHDTAESQMNSAMVMALLPPLIAMLNAYAETRPVDQAMTIGHLTHDMQVYADAVIQAMMRDMEGRTFARRAWLAPGKAMGDDSMYIEPQSFLLQAAAFPVERKRVLLREMQRRLIDGEVLGPRMRETYSSDARMAPGTSENGGFWYSLAGQTIAGVATFDRKAALALLDRMAFRNFGRHYPDYWVGQWTAPDTLNAVTSGDAAGLPRPMDNDLWCKMAVYCAHAHAWPLYCYFRIRDLA